MRGSRLEKDLGTSDAPEVRDEEQQHGGIRERVQTQLDRERNMFQLCISNRNQRKVT